MENISKPNRLQRVFHLCRWNSVDYKDTNKDEINGFFKYPKIELEISDKDYNSYGNSLVDTVEKSEDFSYKIIQTKGFSRPVLIKRDTDICKFYISLLKYGSPPCFFLHVDLIL